jgi:hypothetical protein
MGMPYSVSQLIEHFGVRSGYNAEHTVKALAGINPLIVAMA